VSPSLFIPASANLTIVFAVFIAALILFYLVLVRWIGLGKIGWKYIDYIWLSFGALGLVSTAADVRMTSASTLAGMQERRVDGAFEGVTR
jgi:hypothetical protein